LTIAVVTAIDVVWPMTGWKSSGSRAEMGRAITGQINSTKDDGQGAGGVGKP
jgi:hypothetical protein